MVGKRTLTILIPSAGGVSGTFLVRYLSRHPIDGYDYRIVAADSNSLSVAKRFASAFHVVPESRDPRYEDTILDLIRRERVDVLLPVTSHDTPFFAARKPLWRQLGVSLLACDPEIHERLHNKISMYAWMRDIGVPVPRVYEHGEPPAYPAILKSAEGSGSRGVRKLEDAADYRYWTSKPGEFVVTDFIDGPEFTVDCLFDSSHRLVLFHNRERVKTNGGAVVVTRQAEPTAPLNAALRRIESHIRLEGPVNFQYMLDRDGRLYLTDFNTRFASGGLPLTIAAGYDIPNLMIRFMLGEDARIPALLPGKLTMYRYYDELFAEES